MSDLDQELRELLETKARDAVVPPKPEPQVLKRARRRQAGTVLTALAGTAALVVASIVGVQALMRTDSITPSPADVPVLPEAPEGFRSAVLPFASIAYPEGWSLVAFDEGDSILQLTNFDPEFATPCFTAEGQGLPPLGAMLTIRRLPGEADPSMPSWPLALYEPDSAAPDCRGAQEATFGQPEHYRVSWRVGSSAFVARAIVGANAPEDVREMLMESFSSLDVVESAHPQTEGLIGRTNLVLDSTDTDAGPVALYAYLDDFERGSVWIGIAGPAGSRLNGAGQVGSEAPSTDENVTMNLDEWGGVVWGEVAASVARAELRTVEGDTFPANLLPLPSLPVGLDVETQQIVWGVIEGQTDGRVTTLLYDDQGNVLNSYFPSGPRVTIAEGSDPEAGTWVLYLDVTNEGTGIGFQFETGGGGSGCCLKPFDGNFRLDGWGSGGDDPANITAIGSDALDRVVFEAASGEEIEGQVFPVPDASLGVPKVALVLVPRDVPVEGDLVAYDADGNEIGREFVGDIGEPPGPTPEIDAVWRNLRTARDAAATYFDLHGSFAAVTPDALIDLATERVTFATRPEPDVAHLYVTDDTHLVISSVMVTGGAYCIAVEADPPDGGFGYRYGDVYAQSYDGCRGGWHELQP